MTLVVLIFIVRDVSLQVVLFFFKSYVKVIISIIKISSQHEPVLIFIVRCVSLRVIVLFIKICYNFIYKNMYQISYLTKDSTY